MNKFQLLRELIDELERYDHEVEGDGGSMASFTNWLNKKYGYSSPPWPDSFESPSGHDESGVALTMLITFLFRYAKHYSKKALDNSPLSTLDEFGFLATLIQHESLTKSELIHTNLLEFTSGIEIIKRLIKGGLIQEYADPNDKRSKRVELTEQGRGMFYSLLGPMNVVSHIVSGDLSNEEKALILPILIKLNNFHSVIHKQDRKSDLGEISDKYLSSVSPSDN
ncbi:MAG: winged helix DNA-binding protein [Bacteroidota bacterium]